MVMKTISSNLTILSVKKIFEMLPTKNSDLSLIFIKKVKKVLLPADDRVHTFCRVSEGFHPNQVRTQVGHEDRVIVPKFALKFLRHLIKVGVFAPLL